MYPDSWIAYIGVVILLGTAQIQSGWSQHDYGHFSVFGGYKTNKKMHHFLVGFLKGASSSWWQHRHNRHHAKTNVIKKDPDIHNWPIFIFGTELGNLKRFGWVGTKFQHIYWWFIGPPIVTTVLFMAQIIFFLVKKKLWVDALMIIGFVIRYYAFGKLAGMTGLQITALYWLVRIFESHWFTWITSMSHLPMKIESDQNYNWATLHVTTTQNVTSDAFTDWFTGHLNFQIEHHLFPQMPRHNYKKITKQVKALYAKHGVHVHERSLFSALHSIYNSLHKIAREYAIETSKKSK